MNERTIFLNALEIPDPTEREAYLDQACAGDAGLRHNVAALIKSHEEASGFIEKPAMDQMATSAFASDTPAETRTPTDLLEGEQASPAPPGASELTQAEPNKSDDHDLNFLAAPTKSGQLGRLGPYEIQAVIGKGGFGIVLKGFDERLHRVVAIKVLSPAFAANGAARKRFIREARAAAAVKSDHVVGIYDVQEEGQPPYLVMEYIEGVSLQDKLDKAGTVGVKEILRIGMQIAEGLATAHKQGLVHRDIKPANILLENGVERVKITDFGLARAVDDASVTQSGTVAGTPMYMSPEQAEGLAVDHRSDLFSLGTVLYAMCAGHPPFRASGTHSVLKRVIDASPRPISEINNEIPEWLCDMIAKLHAKRPEDRFQTAKEVAELLGQRLADVQAGRAIQGVRAAQAVSGRRLARSGWILPWPDHGDDPRDGLGHGEAMGQVGRGVTRGWDSWHCQCPRLAALSARSTDGWSFGRRSAIRPRLRWSRLATALRRQDLRRLETIRQLEHRRGRLRALPRWGRRHAGKDAQGLPPAYGGQVDQGRRRGPLPRSATSGASPPTGPQGRRRLAAQLQRNHPGGRSGAGWQGRYRARRLQPGRPGVYTCDRMERGEMRRMVLCRDRRPGELRRGARQWPRRAFRSVRVTGDRVAGVLSFWSKGGQGLLHSEILFRNIEIKGLTPAVPEPGFVSLYNGKDLSAWLQVNDWKKDKDGPWEMNGPVLTLRGSPGESGYLRTLKKHREFHLRFEYKRTQAPPPDETDPRNPGVMWGLQGPDNSAKWPERIGLLFTVDAFKKPNCALYCTPAIKAGVPFLAFPVVLTPKDGWNRAEVICKAGALDIRVNGVGHTQDGYVPVEGYLGLFGGIQGLHLRNIEIKELPPTYKNDKERLQGHWVAESVEMNGEPRPPEIAARITLTFAGNKLKATPVVASHTGEASFYLDEQANPKKIDIIDEGRKGQFGIYRFDGDRFVLCGGDDDEKDRPTEFSSKGGKNRMLAVFKRAAVKEPGWVSLFNGKNLSGWVPVYDQKKYSVPPWDIVEPVLIFKGGKGGACRRAICEPSRNIANSSCASITSTPSSRHKESPTIAAFCSECRIRTMPRSRARPEDWRFPSTRSTNRSA